MKSPTIVHADPGLRSNPNLTRLIFIQAVYEVVDEPINCLEISKIPAIKTGNATAAGSQPQEASGIVHDVKYLRLWDSIGQAIRLELIALGLRLEQQAHRNHS